MISLVPSRPVPSRRERGPLAFEGPDHIRTRFGVNPKGTGRVAEPGGPMSKGRGPRASGPGTRRQASVLRHRPSGIGPLPPASGFGPRPSPLAGLFLGGVEAAGHLVPVDGVPPGGDVVGAAVLIVEVVGVLPDVEAED